MKKVQFRSVAEIRDTSLWNLVKNIQVFGGKCADYIFIVEDEWEENRRPEIQVKVDMLSCLEELYIELEELQAVLEGVEEKNISYVSIF